MSDIESRHAKEILTRLYSGEVIDSIKHRALFSALADDVVMDQVNQHFAILEKRCERTKDGMGFYLYCIGQDKEALQVAEEMLREVVKVIRPMVEWLQLTRIISLDDMVLTTGTELRIDQLLRELEHPQPKVILEELANSFARSNAVITKDSKEHLRIVLKYLERNDYLLKSEDGLVYTGLAKWSVFEEALQYLSMTNNIPRVDDTVQEQLF